MKFVCCSLSGEGISTQKVENLVRIFNGTSEDEDLNGGKNNCETLPGRIEGLSIASEIVRKMGGMITVSSALGRGTEFNVSIVVHVLTLFIILGVVLHADIVSVIIDHRLGVE